jgi:pimeloyl-ACP methyl ester carboxylesterase
MSGALVTDPSVDVHPDDLVPRHDVPLDGRSGFVVVEERQVHYLEWGPSVAPPVVCLHGGGQTAYMYEELGSALRATHHVLAPDLPNHGDSDPLPDDLWGREHRCSTSSVSSARSSSVRRSAGWPRSRSRPSIPTVSSGSC